MERIIKGVSDALGVKTEFHFHSGPPAVHNDESLTHLCTQTAQEMSLDVITPTPSMAGEDFSFFINNTYQDHSSLWERVVHMNGIIQALQ